MKKKQMGKIQRKEDLIFKIPVELKQPSVAKSDSAGIGLNQKQIQHLCAASWGA